MPQPMLQTSLLEAVERFALATQGLSVAELERPWGWRMYDEEGVRFAFFRTYEELRELATTLAAERSPAITVAQRALGQYHLAYRDLQAVLVGVDDDAIDRAPAEGEWPVRRALRHIISADLGFYTVVAYTLELHHSGAEPVEMTREVWDRITGEDEEAFEAQMSAPLATMRAYHNALHERVLGEFAGLTDQELQAPSLFWEKAPFPLRFRLHRFDSHMRQHTVQIEKILAAIGHQPSEARRLLRLIYQALAEAEAATIGAWDFGAEQRQSVAAAITARADEIAAL